VTADHAAPIPFLRMAYEADEWIAVFLKTYRTGAAGDASIGCDQLSLPNMAQTSKRQRLERVREREESRHHRRHPDGDSRKGRIDSYFTRVIADQGIAGVVLGCATFRSGGPRVRLCPAPRSGTPTDHSITHKKEGCLCAARGSLHHF
jgi:hypothetical protein